MNESRKYLSELIGTFVLVLIGCGSAVLAGSHIGFLGISFAFGLSVLAMVYAIGPISGCHINPAITLAMLVARKIGAKSAVLYIVAQCVGAVAASAVLLSIAKGHTGYSLETNGLGQNGFGIHSPDGYSLSACFVTEVVLTAIFIFVIFGATNKPEYIGFAPLAIGLALAFIHMVGIPVTGTSVNPARSLGPALVVGGEALKQVWLFLLAPSIGAILSALIWKGFCEPK